MWAETKLSAKPATAELLVELLDSFDDVGSEAGVVEREVPVRPL